MDHIGLFEAKTNLSKIVEEVRRTGNRVILTKRGQPYVDLVPHEESPAIRRSQGTVLAELDKLRQTLTKSNFQQIKADINEGRL